jgi:signal transduction histidine kinase
VILRGSLRARLFVASAAIVAVSVGTTLFVDGVLTHRAVERATARDLAHQADLLAGRERSSIAPLVHLESLRAYAARFGERIATVPLDKPSRYFTRQELATLRFGRSLHGSVQMGDTEYLYAARTVGTTALVLLRPKSLEGSTWRPFRSALVIAGATGAALAALFSLLLARGIAGPVRRVVAATNALAGSGSAPPVPAEGPDELVSLARSFNELADQLARAREAERAFLLSVSHELKTPLTSIRGYGEAVADDAVDTVEAGEVIAAEAARLERLVGDLLDLGRLNRSEFSIETELIDLRDPAREAVRRYAGQARDFDVTLELLSDTPAPAIADPDRVLQIVSNLVENALRLTSAGGRVSVVVQGSKISVEDTGPGLRPEELGRAFERFFLYSRYGRERPVGTGLGLAIVKELAEGMGGAVAVESRRGGPTMFVVSFVPPYPEPVAEPLEAPRTPPVPVGPPAPRGAGDFTTV